MRVEQFENLDRFRDYAERLDYNPVMEINRAFGLALQKFGEIKDFPPDWEERLEDFLRRLVLGETDNAKSGSTSTN